MDMKIPEFGSLQMTRTDPAHMGKAPLSSPQDISFSKILSSGAQDNKTSGIQSTGQANAFAAKDPRAGISTPSVADRVLGAVSQMNRQQLDVASIEQKLITDPDSVDIHDVTLAMSKAQMSLSIAQTVIDRMITGWNELTTMR